MLQAGVGSVKDRFEVLLLDDGERRDRAPAVYSVTCSDQPDHGHGLGPTAVPALGYKCARPGRGRQAADPVGQFIDGRIS